MIRFETYAGHKTRAVNARTALILWYMNMSENTARRRITEFKFADDPESFLAQIASCVERTYNLTVELNPLLSHESQCLQILDLLHQRGNIRKLKVTNGSEECRN